ncbi:DNA/RNA non-specific endonuclease [Streptomyces sp. NPDC005648]|uniref:DNA/RNA non-specific endonuclease n=1 Tax=Streptomyces sp. NPDC005648 TaxID=3157044 RepID=UPI0033BE565F
MTGTDPSGHCLEDLCIGEGIALYEGAELLGEGIEEGYEAYESWEASEAADEAAEASESDYSYEDDEEDIANAKREEARYEEERYEDEEEGGSRSSRGGRSTYRSSYRSSYRYSYRGPTAAERAAEAARAARIAAARRAAIRAAIRAHAVKLTHSIGTATLSVTHSTQLRHTDPVTKLKITLSLAAVRMGATDNFYFSGGTSDEESEGCGGAGWVKYGERDKANGNRATGVDACLTDGSMDGGTPSNARGVPGYKWAQSYATELGVSDAKYSVNACHLLGDQLGGEGVLANEATCGRSTNSARQDPTDPGRPGNMREFEDDTKAEVLSGADVHYHVEPMYSGNRTVPYAFVMVAASTTGDLRTDVVPNVIYSPNRHAWVNIGLTSCSTCTRSVPAPGVR